MVTVPPPLVLSPLLPTHWVREDGVPRLEAELDLEVTGRGVRDARLPQPARRRRQRSRAGRGRRPGRDPVPGTGPARPELGEGAYRLAGEFQPAQGEPVRVEQPWR